MASVNQRSAVYRKEPLLALTLMWLSTGCAMQPSIVTQCASSEAAAEVVAQGRAGEVSTDSNCAATVSAGTIVPGPAQQAGSQTRTVGVPRGFVVAMIILILLVTAT